MDKVEMKLSRKSIRKKTWIWQHGKNAMDVATIKKYT